VNFFTPDTKEYNAKPEIFYKRLLILVEGTMKILGVTLNIMHNFSPQEKEAATKARKRVPIVKAVMSSGFGFSKEDGLLTFKSLIAPVISYAAPIWLPPRFSLKSSVSSLQVIQNAVL
jgi:hypothetical protein